jgi:hypothetical protein
MPWRGNYYYRSERVNGRPRQVYVGSGVIAQLAAQLDVEEGDRRKLERAAADLEQAAAEAHDEDVELIERLTDALGRAALFAAGFRQHHRGAWRRRREPR